MNRGYTDVQYDPSRKVECIELIMSTMQYENEDYQDEIIEAFLDSMERGLSFEAGNYIFKPMVECDSCGDLANCNVDDYGDMICQKCHENREEEEGTRFLNDAENFIDNNYSHLKRLK